MEFYRGENLKNDLLITTRGGMKIDVNDAMTWGFDCHTHRTKRTNINHSANFTYSKK